jgi:adenine-specific DNA-methyltransferase
VRKASETEENPAYLSQQLITYLGNKRSLLGVINEAVQLVRSELGGRKLVMFDGFSGSGVVSRLFKQHASHLITCDLENYAAVISRCYLANRNEIDLPALAGRVELINAAVDEFTGGDCANLPSPDRAFFQRLYAPANDDAIALGERVFYTRENARRLDHYRQCIDGLPEDIRTYLLGPLLSAASVHANTAGVFKGFYKDRETKVGRFGGSGEDALSRIMGRITLAAPVLSNFTCASTVLVGDTNEIVRTHSNRGSSLDGVDVAYFDPPYNQHPYGSNYFLLNLLVDYEEPQTVSPVSGIPKDWNRSAYNVRRRALEELEALVDTTRTRYLLISFNNEGFISPEDMRTVLRAKGELREISTRYNTFRGSRNLAERSSHVTEHLFLVKMPG